MVENLYLEFCKKWYFKFRLKIDFLFFGNLKGKTKDLSFCVILYLNKKFNSYYSFCSDQFSQCREFEKKFMKLQLWSHCCIDVERWVDTIRFSELNEEKKRIKTSCRVKIRIECCLLSVVLHCVPMPGSFATPEHTKRSSYT